MEVGGDGESFKLAGDGHTNNKGDRGFGTEVRRRDGGQLGNKFPAKRLSLLPLREDSSLSGEDINNMWRARKARVPRDRTWKSRAASLAISFFATHDGSLPRYMRPLAHACLLFGGLRIMRLRRIGGVGRECIFRFDYPAKKDASEVARGFVGQTEVRPLLHDCQSVA